MVENVGFFCSYAGIMQNLLLHVVFRSFALEFLCVKLVVILSPCTEEM